MKRLKSFDELSSVDSLGTDGYGLRRKLRSDTRVALTGALGVQGRNQRASNWGQGPGEPA